MLGFGLVVRFTIKAGRMAEFDALVERTLTGIRAHEPGTLIYASHAVDGSPDVRVFYELYRDRDAFETHEQQPHTREFLDQRSEFVESFEVTFLEAVDVKSTAWGAQ
ncbi:putative quinol monooxygenase [Spongisporangium articulatum]|uniref:Quinol monooxygenase n=1 Tax=Spongisporangium articulatum TaxID=3362603 RepID=A0ABW8AHS6_9ACTN